MEHPVDPLEPNGHDRHIEPRGHHADARARPIDLARVGMVSFGKDQPMVMIAECREAGRATRCTDYTAAAAGVAAG
jgi:hypothetical protein